MNSEVRSFLLPETGAEWTPWVRREQRTPWSNEVLRGLALWRRMMPLEADLEDVMSHLASKRGGVGRIPPAVLMEFADEKNRDFKNLWLEAIDEHAPVDFLHRLWAVYTHTEHEEKKRKVLKIFSSCGFSLALPEILPNFLTASPPLQLEILRWVAALPVLSADEISLLKRVLQEAASRGPMGEELMDETLRVFRHHRLSLSDVFSSQLRARMNLSPSQYFAAKCDLQNPPSPSSKEISQWVRELQDAQKDGRLAAYFEETSVEVVRRLFEAHRQGEISESEGPEVWTDKMVVFRSAVPFLIKTLLQTDRPREIHGLLSVLLYQPWPSEFSETLYAKLWQILRGSSSVPCLELASRFLLTRWGGRAVEDLNHLFSTDLPVSTQFAILGGLRRSLQYDASHYQLHGASLYNLSQVLDRAWSAVAHPETPVHFWNHLCQIAEMTAAPVVVERWLPWIQQKPLGSSSAGFLAFYAEVGGRGVLEKQLHAWIETESSSDEVLFASILHRMAVHQFHWSQTTRGEADVRQALRQTSLAAPVFRYLKAVHDGRFHREALSWSQGPWRIRRAAAAYLNLRTDSDAERTRWASVESDPWVFQELLPGLLREANPSQAESAWLRLFQMEASGSLKTAVARVMSHFQSEPETLEKALFALLRIHGHPKFQVLLAQIGDWLAWLPVDSRGAPLPRPVE